MNKTTGLVAIAVMVLLSVAFSQVGLKQVSGEGKGGKELSVAGMAWKLDFTKEQKDKIAAKESSMQQATLQFRQSIRDQRQELNAELSADNPDNTKVNKLIEDISRNMADIQKNEISFMIWMRQQLTPEQKQKLSELMKDRQGAGNE